MYSSRSLVNASSFSFAGSTLANSGMLRRTSTSLAKLMGGPPDWCPSFRRDQLVQSAAVAVQLIVPSLLDHAAAAHDQDVVELLRPVAAADRPDQAGLVEPLEQSVQNGLLLGGIERGGRVVQD